MTRLPSPPYPGELGQRIFEHISQEKWNEWLQRQTMFINENRLNLSEPSAREFLVTEMEKFLFTDNSETPAGYIPPGE
ncbi:MAG: oxidative damage protection protein [Gammaproteobacteria bacterium]